MSTGGTFLYPSVTQVPAKGTEAVEGRKDRAERLRGGEEFGKIFEQAIDKPGTGALGSIGSGDPLSQLRAPLKFSAHASQRMQERKIALDGATLQKVSDAIDKAESKGVEDTLVLTQGAALIVNVPNRTVVTAMDTGSLNGNVFTNIDGAVIV
jgi:flagellar operon protein